MITIHHLRIITKEIDAAMDQLDPTTTPQAVTEGLIDARASLIASMRVLSQLEATTGGTA